MTDARIDLSGCRVLIVDDVPANLDILTQALEAERYNVLVAFDGQGAIHVATQASPDLILLDIMMPGMDGYETCRRLKAEPATRGIPVVFITARDELGSLLESFRAGGVDYITKPFEKEEVLARIRIHLERDRLARDLARLNAELEQKVEHRTRELQLRVNELQGKDRIAQHMLVFHAMPETLNLVLEVVRGVTDVDGATIHLLEEGSFRAAARTGEKTSGYVEPSAFSRLAETKSTVAEDGAALVPILRGEELMGAIEVGRASGPLTETDLATLASFALQAAVAIQDARIVQDADRWREQLERATASGDIELDAGQLEELAGGDDPARDDGHS